MTTVMKYLAILLISTGLFISCKKSKIPEKITNVPLIENPSISTNVVHFNDTAQQLYISFRVFDLDKNIGKEATDEAVFIDEYRSDSIYRKHTLGFPALDPAILNKDYLEALVTVNLPAFAFTPRTDSIHLATRRDTFYLKYWVMDEDSNVSNVITTDLIYIED